jgi:hypothetical protein
MGGQSSNAMLAKSAAVRLAAAAANNAATNDLAKPHKSGNRTLIVSPWGAVFETGFPLYANPPSFFRSGTRWKQVASPSFQMCINAEDTFSAATVGTQWPVVGGNPPAGGFTQQVQIGVASPPAGAGA